jgi:hypothetical protein
MSTEQNLHIIGFAGVITHAPGGVLTTSAQPVLMDHRLLRAATECIRRLQAEAKERGLARADARDFVGISLCEAVIATARAGSEDESGLFWRQAMLLAVTVHSNTSGYVVVEGRVNEDQSTTILNVFAVPASDFEQGRDKILRYISALNDLFAAPNLNNSAQMTSILLH